MRILTKELKLSRTATDTFVVLCFEDSSLLKKSVSGIEKLLRVKADKKLLNDFTGKDSQCKLLYAGNKRIIFSGLGKKSDVTLEKIRCASAVAAKTVSDVKLKQFGVILLEDSGTDLPVDEIVTAQVEGSVLSLYRFDKYFTNNKKDERVYVTEIIFFSSASDIKKISKVVRNANAVSEGTVLARDMGNEPSNIATPEYIANEIVKDGERLGYSVTVYGKTQLQKMKMGGILAVAQGSANDPRLVIMEYKGAGDDSKPVAFVGKGVTFDTGGISIKPSAGMQDMKMDMGGSAAVFGLFHAVAKLKLKVNMVGVIGLVENMPSGTAYKPGDVITSYSGKTIEVQNTDAEGRIVLADAVTVAAEYKPYYIIDLATLTGAALIALGHTATAVISNSDELVELLQKAGEETHERVWRLPDWDDYDKLIDSEIADVCNVGQGRVAGTIVGGLFVKRFIKKDSKWAHLDIAGTGMSPKASEYVPKFATGVGVRLLTRMLTDMQK